jgi:hypothetical protein
MHGLFRHKDTTEEFQNMLGLPGDYTTLTHEHNWAQEYERRKQA